MLGQKLDEIDAAHELDAHVARRSLLRLRRELGGRNEEAFHEASIAAKNEPLLDGAGQSHAPGGSRARSAADRLLFEMPDATDERAAASSPPPERLTGAPVVVSLEILGALSFLECAADATQRNAAAARAAEAARRALPSNGYVDVAALVARCPRRVGAVDVARLEEAAARAEFRYPRQEAFAQLLQLAERIDGPNARRGAIRAWLALDVAGMQLRAMLEGQADPELRRRAARAVERSGWRTARHGWSD